MQNHSWIGLGTGSTERSILHRADYTIETNDMTMVVGANNNGNPAVLQAHPTLLVYAYNTIVAGRSDIILAGRPTISSRVLRMARDATVRRYAIRGDEYVSRSRELSSDDDARSRSRHDGARSEVIKAMLMAGATKGEFANWTDPTTGLVNPWNRTQTRPLDDVMGAGELNVYNSYLIGIGGKQAASTSQPAAAVGSYGCGLQDRKSDHAVGDLYYNFEVAEGSTAADFSILLAWNAKITDTNPDENVFSPTEPVVQNLNLQLYDSTTSFMGSLLDQSISTVDNVEHIYVNSLAAENYSAEGHRRRQLGLRPRLADDDCLRRAERRFRRRRRRQRRRFLGLAAEFWHTDQRRQ